ncbi:Bifunctional ligase/repressor BirA [Holospora curviuscula]|uniref:Bifunctional ligase/repressor BirA n=1 Tax=Holospora curviuscula TaxID=1082868 RepID=A0A2S5RE51_9PROT|nr:Bifunctional ligase/repressor BirA [Holospora curviuscula]
MSTQALAFDYYTERGIPETTVVFRALVQTQGYGQRGSVWKSPAGNLFLSVLFPIFAHPRYLSELTLIGAFSVIQVLQEHGINAQLKYPNDVFVQHKKISGLLGQVFHTEHSVWAGILGLGLNVNCAPNIQCSMYQATSLQEISQSTWDLEYITHKILRTFIIKLQHVP